MMFDRQTFEVGNWRPLISAIIADEDARIYEERLIESGQAHIEKQPKQRLYRCGRNMKCPCGSGKKFKHCCIR
jgi:hypothetical protein